jgi:hypothetical protein
LYRTNVHPPRTPSKGKNVTVIACFAGEMEAYDRGWRTDGNRKDAFVIL